MASLEAGQIGRAHGLDGSFYVVQPRQKLLDVGLTVFVEGEELSREILRTAGTSQRPIIRLSGVEERSAASVLCGKTIFVRRNEAPQLDESEWWAQDLEACQVYAGGDLLSAVKRFITLPSCDALELENGIVIPLIRDAICEVDLGRKMVHVNRDFIEPLLEEMKGP